MGHCWSHELVLLVQLPYYHWILTSDKISLPQFIRSPILSCSIQGNQFLTLLHQFSHFHLSHALNLMLHFWFWNFNFFWCLRWIGECIHRLTLSDKLTQTARTFYGIIALYVLCIWKVMLLNISESLVQLSSQGLKYHSQ